MRFTWLDVSVVLQSAFDIYSIELTKSRVEIVFSKVDVCIWSNEHTQPPLIYIDYILFTGSEWSQCSDSSDMGIHIVDT